jgi:cytoskeletal protein RodZ
LDSIVAMSTSEQAPGQPLLNRLPLLHLSLILALVGVGLALLAVYVRQPINARSSNPRAQAAATVTSSSATQPTAAAVAPYPGLDASVEPIGETPPNPDQIEATAPVSAPPDTFPAPTQATSETLDDETPDNAPSDPTVATPETPTDFPSDLPATTPTENAIGAPTDVTSDIPPDPMDGATSISITSVTLFDADTDQPIAEFDPLQEGAILNLVTLPSRQLSLVANTAPQTAGSVRFELDLPAIDRVESTAPFALAGDVDGDYLAWAPSQGLHTLRVTPYTEANAGGQAGASLTLTFMVIDTAP